MPLAGGDPEQLTALPHGVCAFAPSPDGKRLALGAAAPETRFAVGPLKADVQPLARVIARVDWRLDGQTATSTATCTSTCSRAGRCARAAPDPRRLVGRELRVVAGRQAHRVLRRPGPRRRPPERARRARRRRERRRGRASSRASRAPARRRVLVAGRRAASPSSASTRRASRSDASTRCGSCRPRAGRRAISLRATICPSGSRTGRISSTGRSTRAVRPEWRDGAVTSPVTSAGHTTLWRFPLAGEPGAARGLRAARPRLARSGGGRIVTLRAAGAGARRAAPRAAVGPAHAG